MGGQDSGNWRPVSTTAKGITGPVVIANETMVVNFVKFPIAEIRRLTAAELLVVATADSPGEGSAEMVTFLASGRAHWIGGATFMAAGGATPNRPRHTPTVSSDIHASPDHDIRTDQTVSSGKILVTGATGFLGGVTLRLLL